jgi:hypothetical protein
VSSFNQVSILIRNSSGFSSSFSVRSKRRKFGAEKRWVWLQFLSGFMSRYLFKRLLDLVHLYLRKSVPL